MSISNRKFELMVHRDVKGVCFGDTRADMLLSSLTSAVNLITQQLMINFHSSSYRKHSISELLLWDHTFSMYYLNGKRKYFGFCVVTPCGLVGTYELFEGIYRLHLQG